MAASNQIFLVVDAGTPVAAFTARPRAESFSKASARRFHQPAGLYVLGQPRDAVDYDDVGSARRVVGARDGSVRTRPNGPRMQAEGKKAKPSQWARASLSVLARALQGLANCC